MTKVDPDQQSGKDEFSFTELVLPDECPFLTIIGRTSDIFGKDFCASCPTGQVENESDLEP